MSLEKEIFNLVIKGEIKPNNNSEEDAAIDLLKKAAEKSPDILWSAIFEAFSYDNVGMAIPAMAAYLCSENVKDNFNSKIRYYFIDLLLTLGPIDLLDLAEYIQSKVFGIGLGSRSQKLLRSVIEKWKLETLKNNVLLHPEQVLSLIKILHPRFNGEKGLIIKSITNKNV